MLRHLGFTIPMHVTFKSGNRHSYPGPGICAECGRASGRTYIRFDDKPYCDSCIGKDLSAVIVGPDDAQRHPDPHPEEMVYDVMRLKGGTDDFELRSVVPGRHADPRMYDRSLA